MDRLLEEITNALIESLPYVEGQRHELCLASAGWLRKRGYTKEEVTAIIERIAAYFQDEEVADRLAAVETTFEKPLDEVVGWSKLVEILGQEEARVLEELIPKIFLYTNEAGRPLYRVLRWDTQSGKTFQTQHFDGKTWQNGLGNTRKVLYRLPQVKQAITKGEKIFIVEGEKCVHALEKLGITATTNPFGAGHWKEEFARQLAGSTGIIILPDNDEVGHQHAQKVLKSLEKQNIPARIVELPGLGPGEDVADLISRGEINKDEILGLVHQYKTPLPDVVTKPEPEMRFPSECLVGIAGDFARLFASYYEAPAEFWFFAFLTVLGHLLADKITLASDLLVQPRLYTVLLGRSGVEKKSTAIRRTIQFFGDCGFQLHSLFGVGSAEGLAEALKENSNLLLVADEFRALASKTRIEGSVLAPMLASLFELNVYDHKTKNKSLRIRNAHLSLLAASTTDSYQLVWDSQNIAIGLPNRLFIVPAQATKRQAFVEEIPESELRPLQTRLINLFEEFERHRPALEVRIRDHRGGGVVLPLKLHFEPAAKELWAQWYEARPQDIHTTRLDTIGLRLALLLTVAQGNFETVDSETVEVVCKMLDWEHTMRFLNDPIDAVNTIAELEEKIRRVCRTHRVVKWRELARKINANRYGTWALETAVQNLSRAGEVRIYRRSRSKIVEYIAW